MTYPVSSLESARIFEPSLSATQSGLQRNRAALLQESLKIAAILQVLPLNRTAESGPSNVTGSGIGFRLSSTIICGSAGTGCAPRREAQLWGETDSWHPARTPEQKAFAQS